MCMKEARETDQSVSSDCPLMWVVLSHCEGHDLTIGHHRSDEVVRKKHIIILI